MRKQLGKIKDASTKRRYRRKLSIRKKVVGTSERPRISVVKSNANISVQAIDDSVSKTLFSVQTFGKNAVGEKSNKESAKAVGTKVAALLKENKVDNVVFDRNGYKYHGVVATLVETIREEGIKI